MCNLPQRPVDFHRVGNDEETATFGFEHKPALSSALPSLGDSEEEWKAFEAAQRQAGPAMAKSEDRTGHQLSNSYVTESGQLAAAAISPVYKGDESPRLDEWDEDEVW